MFSRYENCNVMMCFCFIFVIVKKDCLFDFKVYLMGCFFFLLVRVDNLILYWCFIFCFVGNINLWIFGVNLMIF